MRALLSYVHIKGLRQDRQLAGLVGHGGECKLILDGENKRETWTADWEVGQQNAANRIWRVRYSLGRELTEKIPNDPRSLDTVVSDLNQVLLKIIEFCSDHKLDSTVFRKSMECLHSTHPLISTYHPDLCPEGLLSLPALQLLGASQLGWVFGAMGSWNDLGFEGAEQERYEAVSDNLFRAILDAILSSVNSVER